MSCLSMRNSSVFLLFLILTLSVIPINGQQYSHSPVFDGEMAYNFLLEQCEFGPRPPGSNNLSDCRKFIIDTLTSFNWTVSIQNFTYLDTACSNIVAVWSTTSDAPLLLGAHYDTRPRATSDAPINQSKPILGANDGASGTAVLLELSRILPQSIRSKVELVFFDAEDSGGINGWDWIQGSTYYVSELSSSRRASINAMILVDLVGDASLQLPREASSTDSLQNDVWHIAEKLGYTETFLDRTGSSILDDHRPFLDAGIPALDLIQIPFPWYWHTLEDTPDKCSGESLKIVGDVLEVFVVEYDAETQVYTLDQPFLFYGLMMVIPVLTVALLVYRRKKL
ncbi:M28 family peptidase [Candidatus Thorarchaeota archaeon]|nr:MAG: M28 family peptidase [Candidatus Thorarchaeota archaeon]